MQGNLSQEETKGSIKRKLYYYKTEIHQYNNLFDLFSDYNDKLNTLKDSTENKFENLKDTDLLLVDASDKSRYYFLDVKSITEDKIQCILYSLRDNGFPYLFDLFTGDKREIEHKESDTIMDQTHFTVFPKYNIIVTEFNYFGCRLERLPYILLNALHFENEVLSIAPILNTDACASLKNSEYLKGFSVKIAYPSLKELTPALGLGIFSDMNNTFVNLDNLIVDFSLSENSGLKLDDAPSLVNKLVTFVNNIKSNNSDSHGFLKNESPIKTAKIVKTPVGSRKSITVDLLEDKLMSEISVVKLKKKSKYIDSNNMFSEIDTAFNRKKTTLINNFRLPQGSIG